MQIAVQLYNYTTDKIAHQLKFVESLVIVYVVKRSVCPHTHLCGDIGLGHVGLQNVAKLTVDVYANLPNPEDSDSSEHQTEVQQTINFLTKGCTCKKCCKNKQCSRTKVGRDVAKDANVKAVPT